LPSIVRSFRSAVATLYFTTQPVILKPLDAVVRWRICAMKKQASGAAAAVRVRTHSAALTRVRFQVPAAEYRQVRSSGITTSVFSATMAASSVVIVPTSSVSPEMSVESARETGTPSGPATASDPSVPGTMEPGARPDSDVGEAFAGSMENDVGMSPLL